MPDQQTKTTDSLHSAAHDFECGKCWRPVYTGEQAGQLSDDLLCEQCWVDEP